MSRALPSETTPTVQPCASSRSAAAWSSCTYAARRACAATASSSRHGLPPELVVRPRATEAEIDEAIGRISRGSSGSSRRRPSRARPRAAALTEEQGRREAHARIALIAQSEAAALGVTYSAHHAARPAQPLGLVLEQGHAELQLAARARAARRARLRRRARGLPPRRASTTAPRSGSSSSSAGRGYRESKQWLDDHGWEILAYRPPLEARRVELCARGALGDLRLLRDADRLGRRRARRARARLRRGARRRAARALPRDRARAAARRHAQLPRGADRVDARGSARPPAQEHGLAESLPGWRAFPEVRGCARGAAPPRLEARDPLEHRRRLHRRVAGADRRAVRRGRRRAGDRLVQAGAPALGGVLRAHARAARGPRARRARRSSTTSCPRTSSACAASGSTASASSATARPTRELHRPAARCRRRSTSSLRRPRRERAPRALPRLPHADGGRDRPRLPVPLVRARVRGGARARAARLGRRRRGDGGGRRDAAAVAGGGDDRRGRRSRRRSPRSARELPERPLVLGGCCCAHVGAVRELARRHGRVGVVWLDAHGDLNTPESSPSGNAWGMPLRMLIDAGDVDAATT